MTTPTITLKEHITEHFFNYEYTQEHIEKLTKTIIEYYDDKMVYKIHLQLEHDGYNNDGPESNLYDLYVWTKKLIGDDLDKYQYIIDVWHFEDWHNPSRSDERFWLEQEIELVERNWNNSYNNTDIHLSEPDIDFDANTDYIRSALTGWY